jgi:hypothetical protein
MSKYKKDEVKTGKTDRSMSSEEEEPNHQS